eukprot:1795426-Alexandrium_andersonii.AAC.1
MKCAGPSRCLIHGCLECKYRRRKHAWETSKWGLLDPHEPSRGTWIRCRVTSKGAWGLGCVACAAAAKKEKAKLPPSVLAYARGVVRAA